MKSQKSSLDDGQGMLVDQVAVYDQDFPEENKLEDKLSQLAVNKPKSSKHE